MEAEGIEQPAVAPQSHADKVELVKNLIGTLEDEGITAKGEGDSEAAEAEPVGGNEPGDSPDDGQESDTGASIEDDTQGEAPGDDEEAEQPVNVQKLAEHLGIEAADLYDLEVPIDGFEGTTLGQLKDAFKEHGPIVEARQKIDAERSEMERQLLQTRSELSALMQMIPEQDRNYLIQQAQSRYKGWEKEQESAVLEAIPDWQDETKRATDRKSIVKLGLEYGFSEQEITHTQDARTLRLLRDAARDRQQLRSIDPASKRQPGKPNAPGKSSRTLNKGRRLQQALAKAKASPTMQGKEGAVSQLIRSQ